MEQLERRSVRFELAETPKVDEPAAPAPSTQPPSIDAGKAGNAESAEGAEVDPNPNVDVRSADLRNGVPERRALGC
jgi:hypothetical protein